MKQDRKYVELAGYCEKYSNQGYLYGIKLKSEADGKTLIGALLPCDGCRRVTWGEFNDHTPVIAWMNRSGDIEKCGPLEYRLGGWVIRE